MEDNESLDKIAEAESYHVQAEFILHSLQANIQVYGSNSAFTGATPADIDLALQYIDRCLEYFPDNTKYLNLKALLLGEGKGLKDQAVTLLKRANEIDPRDINVANNLKVFESSQCFIATAAFGTPLATEILVLRNWRDDYLAKSLGGRVFIAIYLVLSPPIAMIVSKKAWLRKSVRAGLRPIIELIEKRYP